MRPRFPIALIAASVMLISASVLVLVLANQNRTLRAKQRELMDRILYPYPGLLVPEMRVVSIAGDTSVIGSAKAAKNELLFFFTTSCDFCKRSLPAWNALADSLAVLRATSAVVYGVSLSSRDSTQAYAEANNLRFRVVMLTDPRMRTFYRARAVPVTAVLGRNGRYSFVVLGAMTSASTVDSVLRVARLAPMMAQR